MGNYSKKYDVEFIGTTPLLMHMDNIEFSEKVAKWRKDPANKKISVAGDDRSPAWTWIGYTYCDKLYKYLNIPSDNIMTMLREAGARISTGKGKSTYKSITQYGLQVLDLGFNFYNRGQQVDRGWIHKLEDSLDFEEHQQTVEEHGFELFLKRAKIGIGARAPKHVRVRPMFTDWSAKGVIHVLDESTSGLTKEMLTSILTIAGEQIGLCDWRPSSPNSGSYGTFEVQVAPHKG